MKIIDLACDGESGWSWVRFRFFLLFKLNLGHRETLEVIEVVLVIDWAVNTNWIVAWLAAMVVCWCFLLGARLIVVEVIIMIFFSGIVVALGMVAISSIIVVCARTIWILCNVMAFSTGVISIWVNWTWVC